MPAQPDQPAKKSPARKKAAPRKTGSSTRRTPRRAPKAPPEAFRQVGQEVLENKFDPECWAHALTISDGGHEEAVTHYARIRTKALAKEGAEKQERHQEFEARRMHFCTNVAEMPIKPPVRTSPDGFVVRSLDALFWHVVGVVALTGALLAMPLLWPVIGEWWSIERMIVVVVVVQVIPAIGWFAGRGYFSSLSYAQAAQVSASLAVVLSLFVGAHLLSDPRAAEEAMVESRARNFRTNPAIPAPKAADTASKKDREPPLLAGDEEP